MLTQIIKILILTRWYSVHSHKYKYIKGPTSTVWVIILYLYRWNPHWKTISGLEGLENTNKILKSKQCLKLSVWLLVGLKCFKKTSPHLNQLVVFIMIQIFKFSCSILWAVGNLWVCHVENFEMFSKDNLNLKFC